MELKIDQGSYVLSDEGKIVSVSGTEEQIQRIMCRLAARRGGFYPLPDFGSRLHTLVSLKPSARSAAARQFIHEALEKEEGIEILAVDCYPGEDESLFVRLELSTGGSSTELRIRV